MGAAGGKFDGDAGGGHRTGSTGDVTAPERPVAPYFDGRGAAVERAEVQRLDVGGEVAGPLARHGAAGQGLG